MPYGDIEGGKRAQPLDVVLLVFLITSYACVGDAPR
jgi:hypothetical protein